MNKEMLRKIRDKIMKDKDEILETIEREENNVMSPLQSKNGTGDIVDMANSVYEAQIFNLINEKEREKLLKIDAAIKSIEEGVYGTCVVCGKKNEQKRLLAIPVTNRCIVCKSAEERKRKTA